MLLGYVLARKRRLDPGDRPSRGRTATTREQRGDLLKLVRFFLLMIAQRRPNSGVSCCAQLPFDPDQKSNAAS